MKNVIKISISGLAFTIEEDGYVLLENYLNQLKKYYTKQENGMEVVEGIEERIAELLRERQSTPEEVVSKELIEEVMAIMGKPEDIEGDHSGQNHRETNRSSSFEAKPKKKLYRNTEDRILGGVCSGIAGWFHVEPLLVRVIFVALALFSSIFSSIGILRYWTPHNVHINLGGGGWIILVYIILWIIVPAARTVAQKCEMRGERPDFSGIQERVKRGAEYVEREVRRGAAGVGTEMAQGVGRVIAFCVGIILLLISIPMLVALPVSMIFSASWAYGLLPDGAFSLIAFNGSLFWFKLLIALVVLLPFVGMFYGGIKLVFNFKSKRVYLGVVIFIAWIFSIIGLVAMFSIAVRPYYGGVEKARKEISVPMQSDTLYIQYITPDEIPGKDLWMEANASKSFLAWFEGERQSLKAIVYPSIRIVRVESEQPMRIRLTGIAAGRRLQEAFIRADESIPAYTLQDSLMTLLPDVFSQNNKWQGNMGEVLVYLPQGKQVVLTSPYHHHFDRSAPRISKGNIRFYAGSGRSYYRDNWTHRDWSQWERKWERWEQRWER